jgi:hypothetical protein
VDELTAWSRDLTVEVGGHGVVSHTGSAALRLLADRTGLTAALSRALRRRGFTPVHDRGRVLADTAVLIADGGRVLSDLAVLRDQDELFGPVASDPTLWRALDEIGPDQRDRIAAARARTRRHVWGLITARHGRIPPSAVADRDLGETIVIRMDATIQLAHSDKQQAAGTFKGTFGHHSLTAWCDNTSESLAFRLRPGNAGSNTAVDHIEVLGEAITQLPAQYRRNLLITCDGAGATLDLVRHISSLNTAPGRRVHYSVGFDLDARGRAAIGQLSDSDWDQVLDHRGRPRDPDDAGVTELTGLLRRSAGGDRLANWPADMRIMCRRERPSSGAQLSLMEQADGWRYSWSRPTPRPGMRSSSRPVTDPTLGWRTASGPGRTPASDTCRRSPTGSIRPGVWPRPSAVTCCAGYACCACTDPWPKPNRRPCATGCCTPPPDWSAANANERSRSRRAGPGPGNSKPASWPSSRSRRRPEPGLTPTVPNPIPRPARGTGARPSDTGHPGMTTHRKQDQERR